MLGVRIPPGLPFNLMIARLKNYIQGITLEWQKVSKPDAKEVQGSTITVIVASALLGLFIGLVDGNSAFPKWNSPLSWIVLAALPVVSFFFVKSWENQPQSSRDREANTASDASFIGNEKNRKLVVTAIACIPLIAVLISQYALSTSLEGFGMAFLRALFIR